MFQFPLRRSLLPATAVAAILLAGCGTANDPDVTTGEDAPPSPAAASEFCSALDAVRNATYDLTASIDQGLLEDTSELLDDAMTRARDEAPDDADAALEVWFGEIEDFQSLLEEHDFDMEQVPFEAWADARVALDSPEVQTARAELAEVVGEECVTPTP
ncbi:MAG: hypothetical protein R3320_05680 [Nitriliruptorales bacterium]|nr:hypothetical protein [Nitriliruptorales bacterium]